MSARGQIGVAVQGAGTVSTEHLNAYLRNPNCRVVAIGSRTIDGAAAKARQVGLDLDDIGIYDNVDELLAHPGLDALSVCTPHRQHPEDTVAAARAGKHVLIEKPVATTPDELYAMDAAVRAAGVRTVVSFVLRWIPLIQAAKAMLAEGLFGEPVYVETDYWHNPEQSGYPGAAGRLRRATIDAMLSGGCHAVDLARYLMGSDVVEVTALETTALEGLPRAANQVALVRFANGKAGKVSAITEPWIPYQFNVDLLGSAGGLRDNRFYSRKLPGVLDWGTFPTVLPNSGLVEHHPFQAEIDHFVDCILSGVESHASLRDAVNTHLACFAISESSRSGGRPVAVPARSAAH
ncbi:MAG: Gfo/Idh/MocA family oxidoreductase [Chloroflexota bacterium]|nr:Gfo/Idh/MocA family oxidoreductase [Chloroflexota bacterium]